MLSKAEETMDELISEAKASDVARSVAVDESGATDNDSSSHAALPDMQSPSRSEAKSVDTNSADPRERSRLDGGKEALPLTVSHAFSNLDNVDLPTYVREHNATLTFPEKVSCEKRESVHCDHFLRLFSSIHSFGSSC